MTQSEEQNVQPIEFDEAVKIIGTKDVSNYLNLSKNYALAVWAAIENDSYDAETMAKAWRTMSQESASRQITENKKFTVEVDFSDLDGVEVFHGREGVETCNHCGGAGERFKFAKKPIKVECLKCKEVRIRMNDKELIINGETVTYDGKDVSKDKRYQKYVGRRVETCMSCKGTGRYVVEDKRRGGKIDVKCKTCHGINIDGLSETTQVLTKCKTCKGSRIVKIAVLDSALKSTTICKSCNGQGFVKPKQGPMNPVITPDLAKLIKS
jgi:hypothetical protein